MNIDAYNHEVKKSKQRDRFVNEVASWLDKRRDFRKANFWFHNDGIKLSTIHSFKGWEASTVFLVIEPNFKLDSASINELMYTSITRAKNNLVILNFGNEAFKTEFTPFFQKHVN